MQQMLPRNQSSSRFPWMLEMTMTCMRACRHVQGLGVLCSCAEVFSQRSMQSTDPSMHSRQLSNK